MIPSTLDLIRIGGRNSAAASRNASQIRASLMADKNRHGLEKPHRLAHFIAQLAHESGAWQWDEEVWGPTPAQRRYEGRADLGNTQPGDGRRFAGRTTIQVTGRSNYRQFTRWVREFFPSAPDFEETPDAILLNPWEGLAPIWYWSTQNLNRWADTNDIETITRRINGGLNGYDDRLRLYTRAALVLLGYEPTDVDLFQRRAGLIVDGKAGPRTRAALHRYLKALDQDDKKVSWSWWKRTWLGRHFR